MMDSEGQRLRGAYECKNRCCKIQWRKALRKNLMVLLTIGGVLIGFAVGFLVRILKPSQNAIIWIGIPGEVYMRMLKMMILPLIICSVITGTSSLDPKCNGKVSAVALLYIIITNSLPSVVGVAVGLIFKPGIGVDLHSEFDNSIPTQIMETHIIFADLIRVGLIIELTNNGIARSGGQSQAQTKYHLQKRIVETNDTGELVNQTVVTMVKTVGSASSTNILGLVLCCTVFGIAATAVGEPGKPFVAFFQSATEIILKILRFTPVGVASLIAVALLGAGHLENAFRSLGIFAVSVFVGLAVYQLLVIPLMYFVLTRMNPYRLLMTMGRPAMITFASASSAIAIPETLNILETKNHVDKRISRFVVPFAATINRDGSALYIATACIFIAQLSDVDLDGGKIVLIWILTTVISLAIPSVPSAGIVSVLINLTALSIPADSIGLLFALEWIIDRVRSSVNCVSHAYCTMVTYKLCIKSLHEADRAEADDVDIGMLVQTNPDTKANPSSTCNSNMDSNMI